MIMPLASHAGILAEGAAHVAYHAMYAPPARVARKL